MARTLSSRVAERRCLRLHYERVTVAYRCCDEDGGCPGSVAATHERNEPETGNRRGSWNVNMETDTSALHTRKRPTPLRKGPPTMIKRTKRDQRRNAGLSPEAIAELNGRPAELAVAPPDPDSETAWMADGNCRLHPPATFFPSDGVGVDKARKICRDCPVIGSVPRVRPGGAHRSRRLGWLLRTRAPPHPQVPSPGSHRLTVCRVPAEADPGTNRSVTRRGDRPAGRYRRTSPAVRFR